MQRAINTKFVPFLILVALIAAQLAPLSSFAAESTFTVSLTTGGVDNTAPTTPTGLAAAAVSSSQIDLSWTASTDDVALGGYRVFRDSIFIATTTGITYSDIGLAAATTYTYTVQAFDTSYNFSGQSAPASATTFAAPTTPATPGNPGGGYILPFIDSIVADPQLHQATISFRTNVPTQSKVFWGKTTGYESGAVSVLFYGTEHSVTITGLDASTLYYIRIEATDSHGALAHAESSFATLSPAVTLPLPNPTNFRALPISDYIHLSWMNPVDLRFDAVRIVRSDKFFPKDPFDGVLIYEGSAIEFDDTDVKIGTTYYYTIFAHGTDGQYSSGALAQARIVPAGEITPPSQDPFADLPQAKNVHPIIAALTLLDFEFIQQGKQLVVGINNTVAIHGGLDLTIRLKYDKVPEVLKTIAFTLVDPEDSTKVFPFLLRVNADKSYYEATIGSLGRSGNYELHIVVLDYLNQGMKRIEGNLRALVFSAPADIRDGFDPLGFILLLILIILIIILLVRRRRTEQDSIATHLPVSFIPDC